MIHLDNEFKTVNAKYCIGQVVQDSLGLMEITGVDIVPTESASSPDSMPQIVYRGVCVRRDGKVYTDKKTRIIREDRILRVKQI